MSMNEYHRGSNSSIPGCGCSIQNSCSMYNTVCGTIEVLQSNVNYDVIVLILLSSLNNFVPSDDN